MKKQEHEITQIGGELATQRLEKALERESNEPTKHYISFAEGIRLQNEIHAKLKRELEEALQAEAEYHKWYDS